mmetsp:Transcript_81848/g.171195  ORF Transcript_81848/g.171195 Transcript_81848/m.171195 type:complete len:268 (+) Transcript_81848:624-1427(+)
MELANRCLLQLAEVLRGQNVPATEVLAIGAREEASHHEELDPVHHDPVHKPLLPSGLDVAGHGRVVRGASKSDTSSQAAAVTLHAQVAHQHASPHGETHTEEHRVRVFLQDVINDLVDVRPGVSTAEPGRCELQASSPSVVQCHCLEATSPQVGHGTLNETGATVVVQTGQNENNAILELHLWWLEPVQRYGATIVQRKRFHLAVRATRKHRPEAAPERRGVAAELEDRVRPVVTKKELDLLQEMLVLSCVTGVHRCMKQLRFLQFL